MNKKFSIDPNGLLHVEWHNGKVMFAATHGGPTSVVFNIGREHLPELASFLMEIYANTGTVEEDHGNQPT